MPAITIEDLNNAKLDVDHIAAVATSSAASVLDRKGNRKKTLFAALGQVETAAQAVSKAADYAAEAATARDAAIGAWASAAAPAEKLAAMAQSVHVGAIVKAFLWDLGKDSDGGAWMKKCQNTSWYQEALGGDRWIGQQATIAAAWAAAGNATGAVFQASATAGPLTIGKYYAATSATTATEVFRGIAREAIFPLLVLEASRLVIYDAGVPGCPMWMVFTTGNTIAWTQFTMLCSGAFTSIAARDGQLFVGSSASAALGALFNVNFISEACIARSSATNYMGKWTGGGIANRNVTTAGAYSGGTVREPYATLVANSVNDVAVTVLDNAPMDPATGLPVPTIAVATAGGTSVIKHDGSVVNITRAAGHACVAFLPGDRLAASSSDADNVQFGPIPSATQADSAWRSYFMSATSTVPGIVGGSNSKRVLPGAVSSSNGLALLKENPSTPVKGMVAAITNAYNSGWQVGDSRGAWLADTVAETVTSTSPQADRSVKNNPLQVVGSITKSAVAAGAQLVEYSGFSAANYLEQPYSANLDFGTAEFEWIGWVTVGASQTALETVFVRDSATTGKRVKLQVNASGFLTGEAFDGTTSRVATGTTSVRDGVRRLVELTYNPATGTLNIAVNGAAYASATGAALLTLNNASAVLRVGLDAQGANSGTNIKVALLRASATVSSADQVAKIYRDELALMQPGAQCTMAGTSSAVTAMAYDDGTDLLQVATSWGRSSFHDLVRVDSEATTVGAVTTITAQGGAVVMGGTSGRIYQPALTLRDELRRKREARLALGRVPFFKHYDATASQTTFVLDKGTRVVAVYAAGTLKREGATKDYTITDDGFQQSVVFGTGLAASTWVSVMVVRT